MTIENEINLIYYIASNLWGHTFLFVLVIRLFTWDKSIVLSVVPPFLTGSVESASKLQIRQILCLVTKMLLEFYGIHKII